MTIYCPVCEQERNIKDDGTCEQCDSYLLPLVRLLELPKTCYLEGVRLKETGRFDEAVAKINLALTLNPEYSEARLELADLYTKKRLYNDAITQYRKVLEIDTNNADTRKGLEEKINTLNLQIAKKEKGKKRLGFMRIGAAFMSGILVLMTWQWWFEGGGEDETSTTSESEKNAENPPKKIVENTTRENPHRKQDIPPSVPISVNKEEPAPVAEKNEKILYTVQRGESFSKIAKEKYGNVNLWRIIWEINKERDPVKYKNRDLLEIGDRIILPVIHIRPQTTS